MHKEKKPQLGKAVVVQQKTLDVPSILGEELDQQLKLGRKFSACWDESNEHGSIHDVARLCAVCPCLSNSDSPRCPSRRPNTYWVIPLFPPILL